MERFSLHWQSVASSGNDVFRPLVVLCPWVWAGSLYVDKYVRLCQDSLGWDVLVVKWPMAAMWFPIWGRSMARLVISALAEDLQQHGERPVVFYAFSGSAKGLFSSVLELLAGQHQLPAEQAAAAATVLRCCVGCIYDSCPVDFTSEAGKKLVAPQIFTSSSSSSQAPHSSSSSSSTGGAAAARLGRSAASFAAGLGCDAAAGTMDFFLLEWFEKDRAAMWSAIENSPVHGPVLFLYSRSDELADAAQIAKLAASLRRKGRQVLEQGWHDSQHCGHYRSHPEQYQECVGYLLSQALQEWAARSSRTQEGRSWAAKWQELPPQQQQQQQQQDYAGHTVHCLQLQPTPEREQNGSEQEQRPMIAMQHTKGILFPSARRQQQQQQQQVTAREAAGKHSSCGGSSTGNGTVHYHPRPARGIGKHNSEDNSSSSSSKDLHDQQQHKQHVGAATGCCCSGGVLAAVTAAAIADASSAELSRALANCQVSDGSSSGGSSSSSSISGPGGRGRAFGVQPHSPSNRHTIQQQQRHAQQHSSRDLTPLVLLSHAAATAGSSSRAEGATVLKRSQNPQPQQQRGGACSKAAAAVAAAAAAAAAAGAGVAGHASISTCCGCAASECRCAETLAAASGEVVCSDSTTLSHSLRCMTSTYLGQQRQQRQQRRLRYHSSSNSSIGDGGNGGITIEAAEEYEDGWVQQQEQAMQLLQQQQLEQPFVQRVVTRLRSRL